MEPAGESVARSHIVPVEGSRAASVNRSSRFGITRLDGLSGYLINREYGRLLPAGQRVIRYYQAEYGSLIVGRPQKLKLFESEHEINQLKQIDNHTLVAALSNNVLKVFSDSDARGWRLIQTLENVHQDIVSDVAVLSDNKIVSCSHDKKVIIWHRVGDQWHVLHTMNTLKSCSDIAVLSSDCFIVASSSGEIGVIKNSGGAYHDQWNRGHSGCVLGLTIINEAEFISYGVDGAWCCWRIQQNDVGKIKYPCPVSISDDGNNDPVIAVLLDVGILAVGYAQGEILIRWQHSSMLSGGGLLWRRMQVLKHGGQEGEAIRGILSLSIFRFVSYGNFESIVIWRLKNGEWLAEQQINKHLFSVADCLEVEPGFFWTIDDGGAIECWQDVDDQWCHCHQIKASGNDVDISFFRTSKLKLLNDKVTVASFLRIALFIYGS